MGFTDYIIYCLERGYNKQKPENREQWLSQFINGPDRVHHGKYNWDKINEYIDDRLAGQFTDPDGKLAEYIREDLNCDEIEETLAWLAKPKEEEDE